SRRSGRRRRRSGAACCCAATRPPAARRRDVPRDRRGRPRRPGPGTPEGSEPSRPSLGGGRGTGRFASVTQHATGVIAVVGATATGKSDLALDLAEALGGEIVNADAMQLYRGMDIGTAKTPPEQRRGIPHHQLDVLDVTEEASVAVYQRRARADVARIRERGRVAVVVGGSGLYVRALLDDLAFPATAVPPGPAAPGSVSAAAWPSSSAGRACTCAHSWTTSRAPRPTRRCGPSWSSGSRRRAPGCCTTSSRGSTPRPPHASTAATG